MLERDNDVTQVSRPNWEITDCSALTTAAYTVSFKQTIKSFTSAIKHPHFLSKLRGAASQAIC